MIAEQRPTDGREVVRSYDTYAAAQEAVDRLADASFPVGSVEIVGHDLSIVEMVTGRLTTARAAAAGAGSGAWFGLFIGLLVGLFTTGPEWGRPRRGRPRRARPRSWKESLCKPC